jgi:cold shock CspA family protein
MENGRVRHLDCNKGYGFIQADVPHGRADFYFSRTSCACDWEAIGNGDTVSFDTIPNTRNPGTSQAVNVRLID